MYIFFKIKVTWHKLERPGYFFLVDNIFFVWFNGSQFGFWPKTEIELVVLKLTLYILLT